MNTATADINRLVEAAWMKVSMEGKVTAPRQEKDGWSFYAIIDGERRKYGPFTSEEMARLAYATICDHLDKDDQDDGSADQDDGSRT